MRAFSKSCGNISIFTLSPTVSLMKFLRSLPDMWASTRCQLAITTLNIETVKTLVCHAFLIFYCKNFIILFFSQHSQH